MLLVDGGVGSDVDGTDLGGGREAATSTGPTGPATPEGGFDAPEEEGSAAVVVIRIGAKLLVAAALLSVAIAVVPIGRPESANVVASLDPAVTTTTGSTTTSASTSTSSSASTGSPAAPVAPLPADGGVRIGASRSSPAPLVIDLATLGPEVHDAQLASTATIAVWVEPEIEPEGEWVDGGNGVALPDLLLRIRFCESTNDYTAVNATSSARGAYQFLTSSWLWYGHGDRYGVGQAHLATPAQQDEAALATLRQDGARPWAESRHCWGGDRLDPRYATAVPPTPTTTTTTAPPPDPSTSTTDTTSSSSTSSRSSTSEPPPSSTTTTPTTTTATTPTPSEPPPSTSTTTAPPSS